MKTLPRWKVTGKGRAAAGGEKATFRKIKMELYKTSNTTRHLQSCIIKKLHIPNTWAYTLNAVLLCSFIEFALVYTANTNYALNQGVSKTHSFLQHK